MSKSLDSLTEDELIAEMRAADAEMEKQRERKREVRAALDTLVLAKRDQEAIEALLNRTGLTIDAIAKAAKVHATMNAKAPN